MPSTSVNESTARIRPVEGPRVRRSIKAQPEGLRVIQSGTRLSRRGAHRLGTPGTVHVVRRFPGLVPARRIGGAW